MRLATPLCHQLDLALPIVQAGMGGYAGPELAAAVSNAGGLGVLGCSGLTPGETRAYIRRVRELTDRPFGVDLIIPQNVSQRAVSPAQLTTQIPPEHRRLAEELKRRHGAASDGEAPSNEDLAIALGTGYEDQLAIVLDERVPVFVGALGSPGFVVAEAHDRGIFVMSIVGSVRQARTVVADGVDAVIAQGSEGGGHTSHVGSLALLPQVVDAVDVPVIGAGGIADGRGLVAALALGCQAAWLGTRFLATKEARLSDWQKRAIVEAGDESTVTTRSYTGKRFRLLPNEWTRAWDHSELEPLPMPLQPVLAGHLVTSQDNPKLSLNGAGSIAGLVADVPSATEVVERMAQEATSVIGRLSEIQGAAAPPMNIRESRE